MKTYKIIIFNLFILHFPLFGMDQNINKDYLALFPEVKIHSKLFNIFPAVDYGKFDCFTQQEVELLVKLGHISAHPLHEPHILLPFMMHTNLELINMLYSQIEVENRQNLTFIRRELKKLHQAKINMAFHPLMVLKIELMLRSMYRDILNDINKQNANKIMEEIEKLESSQGVLNKFNEAHLLEDQLNETAKQIRVIEENIHRQNEEVGFFRKWFGITPYITEQMNQENEILTAQKNRIVEQKKVVDQELHVNSTQKSELIEQLLNIFGEHNNSQSNTNAVPLGKTIFNVDFIEINSHWSVNPGWKNNKVYQAALTSTCLIESSTKDLSIDIIYTKLLQNLPMRYSIIGQVENENINGVQTNSFTNVIYNYMIDGQIENSVTETINLHLTNNNSTLLNLKKTTQHVTGKGKGNYTHSNNIEFSIENHPSRANTFILTQVQHLELTRLPIGAGPFLPTKMKEGLEKEFNETIKYLSKLIIAN